MIRSSSRAQGCKEFPKQQTTERILGLVPRSSEDLAPSQEDCVRIAARAYELWEQRGRLHGHDVEDWLEAERSIRWN